MKRWQRVLDLRSNHEKFVPKSCKGKQQAVPLESRTPVDPASSNRGEFLALRTLTDRMSSHPPGLGAICWFAILLLLSPALPAVGELPPEALPPEALPPEALPGEQRPTGLRDAISPASPPRPASGSSPLPAELLPASRRARSTALAPAVYGRVRDGLGNAIQGAELLIVGQQGELTPLVRSFSDRDGRIQVDRLPAGVYRFAILKPGFATRVGSLNTRLQKWFEVVLQPARSTEEQTRSVDENWFLRLPRRSIFRQSDGPDRPEGTTPQAPSSGAVTQKGWAVEEALRLKFEHLEQFAGIADGSTGSDVARTGSETRLRVDSRVGTRTQLHLEGRRERVHAEGGNGGDPHRGEGGSKELEFGVTYAPRADATLEMSVDYTDRKMFDRSLRNWGTSSKWQMQIDPSSKFDVAFDYRSTALDRGSLELESAAGQAPLIEQALRHERELRQMLRLAAGYATSVDNHSFTVTLDAAHHEAAAAANESETFLVDPSVLVPQGWTGKIEAADAWSVRGPITLHYGLGYRALEYRHSELPQGQGWVVPHVGATWAGERAQLAGRLSRHSQASWRSNDAGQSSVDSASRNPWGYRLDAQLPLGSVWTILATREFKPSQWDVYADTWRPDAWQERQLFISDGQASQSRDEVRIEYQVGEATAYLSWAEGEVEGWANPSLGYASGLRALTRSELEYLDCNLGLRVEPSGTDLRIIYRGVEELQARGVSRSQQDALEIRLLQDLLRMDSLGHWRFLVAVRMESQRQAREDSEKLDPASLSALNDGVSAGLSVIF